MGDLFDSAQMGMVSALDLHGTVLRGIYPALHALDVYEPQGLQELRWQLGAQLLRTEKPAACVGGISANIFKLKREASSRHGDRAAKKLYFASLKVFVSFILTLALNYPFFSVNIVVAITFRKSILTITLLLLSLLKLSTLAL